MTDKFEDPTPTTLEWLVACGGDERGSRDEVAFESASEVGTKLLSFLFPSWHAFFGDNQECLPGTYETRGKVRRLFQAFGLALSEPEEVVSLGLLWAVRKPDGMLVGQYSASDSFWAYMVKPNIAGSKSATVIRIA